MSYHLSHDEFIEALDHALAPARRAHLDTCDECRASLAELEGTVADAAASGPVPEPSPLFWDHLSARIREATRDEPLASHMPWWRGHWRSIVAAAAAVVLVGVTSWRLNSPTVTETGTNAVALGDGAFDAAGADDGSWKAVGDLAAALSSDDVQWVVAPGPMAPSAMTDLTPREREAFVRLLNVELNGEPDRADPAGVH